MDEVDSLTPVAQDYLKVVWGATEWGEPPITTTGLAARFGTTAANVSETVRRLAAQGLVEYQPYRPVALTERGRRLAMAMVRRHRLIECFLAQVLGYGWDEVHDEAERLEHAVSDDFLARIDRLLDHPQFDPHGDPIPGPDGTLPAPAPALLLSQAAPGRYLVARVSDADPDALARLRERGLVPGVVIDSADLDPADPDLAAVRVRPVSR
ncbi:MAG: metal-dependent transcriptional regulator [Actinobacteria bacterium]|nr:metal-dependent transcriptional regulator [Actinomycetota bacterium]